jgi:uncharacterized protein with ParB-like and HNH nuclease domain
MSNVIEIQAFLLGKTFNIPTYQRDYSWTTDQVDDLLTDVQEALEYKVRHYLGTLVLAEQGTNLYEIVDGQQRLSTLTLIIYALLTHLDFTDRDRISDEAILLRDGKRLRLDFGRNATFIEALFADAAPLPGSRGQRKLLDAFDFANERAKALVGKGGTGLIKQWLSTLKSLEIIQFIAADTGRAIRMFQTVNDRGVPLTAMDKAKALLVYYSNRHLGGSLDLAINNAFGDCFAVFDALRESAGDPAYRIANIARATFTEDDILRYHYLAYSYASAVNASDYDGTLRTVFDGFLKGTLKRLCLIPADLRDFIEDYISDLRQFAQAFRELIALTRTDDRIYRLFVVLALAARLYPLAIRLQQRDLLNVNLPGTSVDLLHCLEVCDVRVYKTRGTDPAKDVGELSHNSRTGAVDKIAEGLRSFTIGFMPNGLFQNYLSQDMYRNEALILFLIRYDETVAAAQYGHVQLVQMVTEQITREHIIAQTPNWAISSQGFSDEADFAAHLNMLGNLTLLSKSDNSRCLNQPTHTKMTDPRMYATSTFAATRQLAHQYGPKQGVFTKADILTRTDALRLFIMNSWAIW